MPGGITSLTGVRDLIATALTSVSGLNVYKDGATVLDATPSLEMGTPTFRQPAPDERENQLGSFTWTTEWTLTLKVSADEVSLAGDSLLQYLALIGAAVNTNQTLGTTAANGFALQTSIVNGRELPMTRDGDSKAVRTYEMTLAVLQLV